MPTPLDLTGQTFGRWRVLGAAGRNGHRQRLWQCLCDPELGGCGRLAERTAPDLRKSLSCGCLRGEQVAERNRRRKGQRPRKVRTDGPARWARVAADPAKKAAHARRVTEANKAATYVRHSACAHCGRPFVGPPTRLHCSRECLDAVIASGKYRGAFHRRRVVAESAALAAELQRRLDRGEATE